MPITNQLTKQVDLPVWEWTKFAPVSTSSLTALTTARNGEDRYLYYFAGASLFRYDTWGDTWQLLSTNATPVTAVAVQYTRNQGFSGEVISTPANNQLRIPSLGHTALNGYKIQIISGTGAGQEREIVSASTETIHESGVVTSASGSVLTDTTRRWKQNQWVGFSVRVTFNTGLSQFRKITYNSENALTVLDANYDARDPFMNGFSSTTPYGTPVSTAGAQANFVIASQVVTVDSPWTVNPDSTSIFKILSGGIWFITSNASSPFFNLFYYDIISDNFLNRVNPAGLFPAAIGTDLAIMPMSKRGLGNLDSGTASSATSRTLVDSTKTWAKGTFNEFYVEITGGLGVGQIRRIASGSTNTLSVSPPWNVTPNNTSTYRITAGDDIFFAGNGRAQMLQYLPGPSVWSLGNVAESGIVPSQLAVTRSGGLVAHSIASATRNLNGITAISATPTAGGTGYIVGDILTVSTGGTLGRVYVESINPQTGAVLTVSLYTCGTGYSVGTGRATTGGAGSGCTVQITSVGTIGVFTTSLSNDINFGETVTFTGATEAAWNTTHTVLGVQSLTVFEAITTATANAAALYAQATTLLVDATKNWVPNEFAGKILGIQSNGLAGAVTFRRILGNSSNTITFLAGTAPTNGTSRYFIQELEAFGKDSMFLADNQLNSGYATSGSVSTLTDSTKSWYPGAFAGTKVDIQNIDGTRMEDLIAFNSTDTLTTGISVMTGSGTNTLAHSFDRGVTWIGQGASIFSTAGSDVCWSGTRFVAVGSGTNTLAYSDNGITWTGLGTTIFSTSASNVAWNGVRFVAVGTGTNTIAWSNDGVTWTGLGVTIFSTAGIGVTWNGSRFVAVGEGTNSIAWSLDGITWNGIGTAIFSTRGNSVAWAGTRFVAVGQGTNSIATSTDGVTWTGQGVATFATAGNGVVWNGTRVVAAGQGTNSLAYSNDGGLTWVGSGVTIFSTAAQRVLWNGVNFVAGGAGTNTLATSADGITWTGRGSAIFTTQASGGESTTPFQSVVPSIGVIPDSNSLYRIMDSYGTSTSAGSATTLNDAVKRWKVNQWAGKRCIITSGTGIQQEFTITSNTATQLTFATITGATAPDVSSTYTIIGKPPVGVGINLIWNFGSSDNTTKGRYLFLPRGGGSHTLDKYNVNTNRWDYGLFIFGHGETLTTGSMYAYDGDRIYFQRDSTGRVFYYDILKNEIHGFGLIPFGMGTAVIGNRMEIIKTEDNLKYLYIMRHSSNEMFRTIIYV